MIDQELKELQQRNAERIQQAKEAMGNKFLLHPENKIEKVSKVIDIKVKRA